MLMDSSFAKGTTGHPRRGAREMTDKQLPQHLSLIIKPLSNRNPCGALRRARRMKVEPFFSRPALAARVRRKKGCEISKTLAFRPVKNLAHIVSK
jgi:hypothetical protein